MKAWMVAVLFALICGILYWPQPRAEFVLDDYYTVVRNPQIKNPSLYGHIWTSRLFDAHQSAGYIKFGYYRPVLQSSWILDYSIFHLKAGGYQLINLLIHGFNCFLIYVLWLLLFGQSALAFKASLLFCVLPTQEWVVRYVTGRGDELSAFFALLSLVTLVWVIKNGNKKAFIFVIFFWILSTLTREVAISYILYAFLIYHFSKLKNSFSLYWFLIGILPLIIIAPIIPKQGNILCFHVLYFSSIGLCLWMAHLRLRWVLILVILLGATSFYQGRFWTSEENLLRHTRSLEWTRGTVVDQQLLMKYEIDIPAVNQLINQSNDPLVKAMWLRRLGKIYFDREDLSHAQQYFSQALLANPYDVDTINAMAVVYIRQGQDQKGLEFLKLSLQRNPQYADTLKSLGLYYYLHQDLPQARLYLNHSLQFDPDNPQTQDLLRLANQKN